MGRPPRIVIVGGGFGGVYVARRLARMLAPGEAELCLVNRENYFVFQPLLPEVIAGSVGIVDTVSPIRRLCPQARLYVREVEHIDLDGRQIWLAPGSRPRTTKLDYDYLVLAPGATTRLGALPGGAEHALPLRTLGDALRLRNRVLQALEEADTEPDEEFRRRLLTFVVAGGGFSGVEVVAQLNDLLRAASVHYRGVRNCEVRCVLVHAGDRILPEVSPKLARYAQRLLAARGVEVRLRDRVVAATSDSVLLARGQRIPARTLVSTVPSSPGALVQSLRCAKQDGRIATNDNLEVAGQEGRVWALGDCASIRTAQPSAQHAVRQAHTVAANIVSVQRGRPQRAFRASSLGHLASLGHRSAVAELFNFRFSGFGAWLLWRTVYLLKLPGLDRKARIALDWLGSLAFPTDLVGLRLQPSDGIASEHFEAGETIFEQGDVGDRAYVIRHGEVEVVRDGARLGLLHDGDCFGEMALLSRNPRMATTRATCATDVLAIGKDDFAKLLASFPQLEAVVAGLAASRSGPRRAGRAT